MNVGAYCAKRYEGATLKALAGVEGRFILFTCPPLEHVQLDEDLHLLEGFDLVVFNLHGLPHIPVWTGDGGMIAVKQSQIEQMNFNGCGIFAINCWLGDEYQPIMKALFRANAGFVIAGQGLNYGGVKKPAGADILLKWFIHFYQKRSNPEEALKQAKIFTVLTVPKWSKSQVIAFLDAVKFELWRTKCHM